ncbi:C40 family peptidase [Allorhizobium taibaishanense]|uniref:Cell wall-associated NlpC family hydrolase n=1 Tax=Allorhizobium taibaishanense TaxID=887144 RepID=A0A1Q9A8F9_9HYPH|nr:NlpC/P60 family protein [Allorhizobium taibaishanense]MBB4009602.1 cell wall-associated NlpC family hydrolase [Allorhizobium taibaishanense]OLP50874.1 peptidase P60 [Allorhizobium taibaishanense]
MAPDHKLDRRLNAYRPDLADAALASLVEAERFVEGIPARVTVPVAALRPRPDLASGIDTELLLGEEVKVFDRADGWAWVKAVSDGYVGYLPETALGPIEAPPTHWVTVPRSFLYTGPDLRFPNQLAISMGSRLTVTGEAETRGTRYFLLDDGRAVIADHCRSIGTPAGVDYVAVAARFLETPYLWGGRSGHGIDCSGLVQLSMLMCGLQAPRDSDMQAAGLGNPIDRSDLRRGDLIFWKGHAGIMEDERTLLHANGHTMSVAREDVDAAIARIGWLYEQPTGYRRPERIA